MSASLKTCDSSMNGIKDLLSDKINATLLPKKTISVTMSRYILWFANQYNTFRIPEFESLSSLLDIEYEYIESPSEKVWLFVNDIQLISFFQKPFILIKTRAEKSKLKNLMSRTVLARSLYELWTNSYDMNQFYKDLTKCPNIQMSEYKNSSFRIQVESYNKKLSTKTKVEKIENISFLPFDGKIDLNEPENSFHLFEYYGNNPNEIPSEPFQILFGRKLMDSNRKDVSNLSLKKRKFIANTSMEPMLGLLMANIAQIKSSDLVFDPFVGSGSLLVSAAYRGAYVMGADIDYLLIHGLTKPSRAGVKRRDADESILSNLRQYQLEDKYIDIVITDSSKPIWRTSEPRLQFDAIITDPPYGKRESRERIGSEKQYKIPDNLIEGHIPSKVEYNLNDIFRDLLNFSAYHLKIGGRLVFWLPFDKQTTNFDVTQECNPCLRVISISEQILSTYTSRILIAVEKYKQCLQMSENSDNSSVISQQTDYNLDNILKIEN